MASRSFKPASYLAQAAQQKPSRAGRPSFARSGSASSTASNRSEDGFLATFRSLNTKDAGDRGGNIPSGASSPQYHTPGNSGSPAPQQKPNDTPSRKRSKPIAIELPARNLPTTYTPLTGRGEQKGGYFPDYEDTHQEYRSHAFSQHHIKGLSVKTSSSALSFSEPSTPVSPSNMSACSSQPSPVSEVTPRLSMHFPMPHIDTFPIPKGKYYPSNYISPNNTEASTPRVSTSAAPTNLQIPSFDSQGKRKSSKHERNSSDVKRKLQQYQRDMIAQARQAAPIDPVSHPLPKSMNPRLLPLGSPGPINTPLELEESDGYLVAGTRARGDSNISRGLEREQTMIDSMISLEQIRMDGGNLRLDG